MHTFPFDHVHEPTVGEATSALLVYVDILSPEFPELHQKLFQRKQAEQLRIILRWKPTEKDSGKKLILSGYGVGLDLKRVDYITIDDRDLTAQEADRAKVQKTHKSDRQSEARSDTAEDVFAEADEEPSEMVQLKQDQLLGSFTRIAQ